MLELSGQDTETLFQRFGSRAGGLSEAQASAARERHGRNEVDHEAPLRWYVHLWYSYRNPFNLLLTALASLSWVTDVWMAEPDDQSWRGVIIIGSMVVISTLLRFAQERRPTAPPRRSRRWCRTRRPCCAATPAIPPRARSGARWAWRHASGSRRMELPLADLVPGDVVLLSAGDMIPADCRILTAKDLFVAQAALTGESLPVEKSATQRVETANSLELENMAYMGTNVVSGSGTALIVATGADTYFGQLAGRVTQTARVPTQFQHGINRVSWVLIRFMLVMAPIVMLINGFTKGDWLEALLFALAIAVGLTPEMLPMIVTATLARGGADVAAQGRGQAPGRHPEPGRHERAVHRQDRHADAGPHRAGTPYRCVRRRQRRRAGLRLPEQLLPDRIEEPAGRGGAAARRGGAQAESGGELPQGRRDSLRLRASPHVGGGERGRERPRTP